MAQQPDRADIVVIGAGVVGNSAVSHLAELGWRSIVQIDKGPLPDPGGSTGHASNFVFPVDHSKEITDLTVDSLRQYSALDVLLTCGGIEVARSPGTDAGAHATHELRPRLGRRGPSDLPRRDPGARPVLRRESADRRLPYAHGGDRRSDPGGRADARARGTARCAHHVPGDRGARHRGRRWPCLPRGHRSRDDRGRDRGGRLRRVEPPGGRPRRRCDPADARGAPDGRRGPDPAARAVRRVDQLPAAARHGLPDVRAPTGVRPRDRLLCAPSPAAPPGGDPCRSETTPDRPPRPASPSRRTTSRSRCSRRSRCSPSS